MSVLLVSDRCFVSSRSCSCLTYDEKLALWTVRHLFGPSVLFARRQFSLRAFYGRDVEPVLALAATIYITGINALSSTTCNQEEIALLAHLEREQNLQVPLSSGTKKERVVRYVSALLAARGCWLPHYDMDMQKGEGLFLQAAE